MTAASVLESGEALESAPVETPEVAAPPMESAAPEPMTVRPISKLTEAKAAKPVDAPKAAAKPTSGAGSAAAGVMAMAVAGALALVL